MTRSGEPNISTLGRRWWPWDGTCIRPGCPNRALPREAVCGEHLPAPARKTKLAAPRSVAGRIVALRQISPDCPAEEIAADLDCAVSYVYAIAAENGHPFGQPHNTGARA